MRTVLLCAAVCLSLPACGSSEAANPAPQQETPDASAQPDAGEQEAAVESGADASEAVEPQPPSACDVLGLPAVPFVEDAETTALHGTAADFTVPTTDGEFGLKASWTGCDSVLIIQDVPKQEAGWTPALWSRDVNTLFTRLPKNVQLLFVSTQTDAAKVTAALDGLKALVDEQLAKMSLEDAAWWQGRVHYVTTPATQLPGWVGTLMKSPGWGIGIDRRQRIRFIGSYADPTRYDSTQQWFAPNLSMVANEAVYYNYEAEREARLAAQNATVVPVFKGEKLEDPGWAGTRGYADVTLPDEATMQGFDTLEADLHLGCVGGGELGDCPAWDYDVFLYLCDKTDPTQCNVEFAHWITTYHREGRWVHDLTPLLPLLAKGGTRRFAFYTQQPYEVTLSLRLSSQGKAVRPVATTYLFGGGNFNAAYNAQYSPVTLQVPADAKKVEISMIATGHGGVQPGNCAEFCRTTHDFLVNGTKNERQLAPEAGSQYGCMNQIEDGTVPNQYGTWWYGRSGWCPGKQVSMYSIDITDQVKLGQDNVFEYEGFYNGAPYPSDGAVIRMDSWLVVSK